MAAAAAEMLIPLKRIGTPDEAAGAMLMLASPYASFISGQVSPLDCTLKGGSGCPQFLYPIRAPKEVLSGYQLYRPYCISRQYDLCVARSLHRRQPMTGRAAYATTEAVASTERVHADTGGDWRRIHLR